MAKPWIAIALVSGALTMTASTAHGEDLTFGRLTFPVPAGWTVKDLRPDGVDGGIKALVPSEHPDAAFVQVLPPVSRHGMALGQRVQHALAALDKGRAVVKKLPGGVTTTKGGFPCGVEGQVTKGPKGDVRFRMLYGFCVGSEFQVMSVVAGTPVAFQSTVKGLSGAMEGLRVVFPKGEIPPGLDPVSQSFLHVTYDLHRGVVVQKAKTANEGVYQLQAPAGGGKTFGVVLRVDLQATVPASARDSLVGWLRSAEFGVEGAKGTLDVNCEDFEVDGRKVSVVRVQEMLQGGWASRYVAALGYGPGWSLRVGSAVGRGEDFGRLSVDQRNALGNYMYDGLRRIVLGIAASARWGEEPKQQMDLVQRLIEKKSYRYRSAFSGGQGEFMFNSSNHTYWTFNPDHTCVLDSDSSAIFSDVHRDMGGNRTGTSGGSLDGAGQKGIAKFTVIKGGDQCYLVVLHPSGESSLHLLEFEKHGNCGRQKFVGLAIDGQIEGSYKSGNGYDFRE